MHECMQCSRSVRAVPVAYYTTWHLVYKQGARGHAMRQATHKHGDKHTKGSLFLRPVYVLRRR